MFSYLLVGIMVASLVYVIHMLGEYRPFVEETELKIDRLKDSNDRLEREAEAGNLKLAEVQGRVGEAADRHDELQELLGTTSKQIREAQMLEAKLETEMSRADYRRSR